MTEDMNAAYAHAFDCGDGVPVLSIVHQEVQVEDDFEAEHTGPMITARRAAVLATVVGQLGIGVTILLGGNPVIGAFAALMMICGLALALAEVADARS